MALKYKIKQLVSRICFWTLEKVGCRVPVIRPVNICYNDLQRVRCQEILTYELLTMTRPGIKNIARHKVREAMAHQLAEIINVNEANTPDGLKLYCDVLITNYPILS